MIRAAAVAGALLAGSASGALAATAVQEGTLASWLAAGFEVKAAFSDNSGGAYIILQKGTDAYMCHSNPTPRCEKLN